MKGKPNPTEYVLIESQFEMTPNPDESGVTRSLVRLKSLLDSLGFVSNTTYEAYFLARYLLLGDF